MQSNECRVEGVITSLDLLATLLLIQEAVGLLCSQGTGSLPAHCPPGPQCCSTADQSQPVSLEGAFASWMHDFAFVVAESLKVLVGPLL